MQISKVLGHLVWLAFFWRLSNAATITPIAAQHAPVKRQQLLQDLVTFDEHSVFVRGERLMIFSGEFHPFRLPVPDLWLDVFQKIKSMGFNGVSFYVDWGLVEGNTGVVNLDGVFSLDPFFQAAAEAGIYLLARPGPYINAETASGGFPGWTLRIDCVLRSSCPEYQDATKNYLATVGRVIADAQITNGGPIIMVQPENEYSAYPNVTSFPDQMNRDYMAFIEQQLRDAGIVVPFFDNDNLVLGSFAPGTGEGAVDIYGIDAYPLRYDCANPSVWPTYRFPRDWQVTHQRESPSTPFAIPEFQGGSGTSWGGASQDGCNALVNEEAVKVVYKNNYSFGVKLFNIYMTFGGTNWGNLGYMGGDTSYDYGAAITEDRHVWREKYSEEKLQANFFKVSPAYLTAVPGNASNGSYVSTTAVAVTPLFGTENGTNLYVVRQADFTSTANVSYTLSVSTSGGNVTIPQLSGQLSLLGRDSKIHVTDYDLGGINLVYSTADIFTWTKDAVGKRVLIVYGGINETHEFAFPASLGSPDLADCHAVDTKEVGTLRVVQWRVTSTRQIITFDAGNLEVHLLWRNDAYNHWVLELPAEEPIANYSSPFKELVIVRGSYLLRTAAISGCNLALTGDINATTDFEVIHAPSMVESLSFNEVPVDVTRSSRGTLQGSVVFEEPIITLPSFLSCEWMYLDTLPEVQNSYNDSLWTICDHNTTTNPLVLTTPTSLYASDYGYHTGSLLYRGHFVANGQESTVSLNVSGGYAFGHSIFHNNSFLGSWIGDNANKTYAQTLDLPVSLGVGELYTLTVLIDHMGQDEEAPGTDAIKFPMGIIDYSIPGHAKSDISWKMTGNLGGEQYRDLARGPRNEGAMYAERQGYHLPSPPSINWTSASPITTGLQGAGVGFYSTRFDLHMPSGYDIPMSFIFANNTVNSNSANNPTSSTASHYRIQLFVNGYQFGKYISHLGPQSAFPVPEGILNYNGTNYISLTLWALDAEGARIGGLELRPDMPVMSGYKRPRLAPMPAWERREGAY